MHPEQSNATGSDNHEHNIQLFWAAVIAGLLPAISTPLATDVVQRQIHLQHVQKLLKRPVILTRQRLVHQYLGLDGFKVKSVEALESHGNLCGWKYHSFEREDDLAILLLTSGSTGNAKAVPLSHSQIWNSVKSKSQHIKSCSHDVFLN